MRKTLALWAQLSALHLSFALHRSTSRPITWVVGPTETAGIVRDITAVVEGSYSALLARHAMYGDRYDWLPPVRSSGWRRRLAGIFEGPWLLGKLAARSRGFIYVGAGGFLWSVERDYEYQFLRDRGLRIVCYFTGSDIRSPKLMQQLEDETGEPNIATWLRAVAPGYSDPAFDAAKERMGRTATAYADLVFTAQNDQRGYVPASSEPFLYFYPDTDVLPAREPLDEQERLVVVHAPSSPVIKGTQLVRAAVRALREEGYDFEYVELQGVPNSDVRAALRRAHIVLNEFFAFMPGVFAVEAMAAGCAVLTRAEERMEPQLPSGSDQAWLVTRHHEVEQNLRLLLDDRARIATLASAGREWVLRHAVSSVSGPLLNRKLQDTLERAPSPRIS